MPARTPAAALKNTERPTLHGNRLLLTCSGNVSHQHYQRWAPAVTSFRMLACRWAVPAEWRRRLVSPWPVPAHLALIVAPWSRQPPGRLCSSRLHSAPSHCFKTTLWGCSARATTNDRTVMADQLTLRVISAG